MKKDNATNKRNHSLGSVSGLDVQEIKGQRWEYVLFFSLFMGYLGIDRIITGRWILGIIKLLTGLFGLFLSTGGLLVLVTEESPRVVIFGLLLLTVAALWWLIDLIAIATENFVDSKGNYILRYPDEARALSNRLKNDQPTLATALKEFNDLKEKGIITEEEFQKKKEELMR